MESSSEVGVGTSIQPSSGPDITKMQITDACHVIGKETATLDLREDEQQVLKSDVAASGKCPEGEHWVTPLVAKLIFFNCSIVFVSNLADSAMPIWCMATVANGGLGWPVERIGEAYSFCGMFGLVFQLVAAPALLRKLGARRALYFTLCVNVPMYIMTPQLGMLSRWVSSDAVNFVLLVSCLVLKQICNSVGHTGLAMITNSSVSASVRCRVQGTMTSVQSAMQAAIPTASGSLFAWALVVLPFGSEFVFLLSALLSIGTALFSLTLPKAKGDP